MRRYLKYLALLLLAYLVFTGVYLINERKTPTQATQPVQTTQTVQLPNVEKPTAQRLLELTNAERAKAGVKPLIMDERLNQSAQKKADEMAIEGWDETPHVNDSGLSGHSYIFNFMPQCKYGSENLLHDYYDVNAAFAGWMNSQPHKAAILDARYEYVGFAINGGYVAQHFCDFN